VSLNQIFTPYGSIKAIKFVGDRGTRSLKGEAVRTKWLRSTRFTITEDPSGLRLYGRGGVMSRMSQWELTIWLDRVSIAADFGALLSSGTSLARIQARVV